MTVEYKLKEEREYPYVGVLEDGNEHYTMVLFVSPKKGVCISSTIKYNIKDITTRCREDWTEEKFVVCEEITIKM